MGKEAGVIKHIGFCFLWVSRKEDPFGGISIESNDFLGNNLNGEKLILKAFEDLFRGSEDLGCFGRGVFVSWNTEGKSGLSELSYGTCSDGSIILIVQGRIKNSCMKVL